MRRRGYPPDLVEHRSGTTAVARSVIVFGTAKPAREGVILLGVKFATATTAAWVWADKPRTQPWPASKGPLLFNRNDLRPTIEGDDSLGTAQPAGANSGMALQEPMVLPFRRSGFAEGCHRTT